MGDEISGGHLVVIGASTGAAASRLAGVAELAGRRFSELMAGEELFWLDICDRVARTGVAQRVERPFGPFGRPCEVHVCRVAEAPRRVALVFRDAAVGKRAGPALRHNAVLTGEGAK